MALSSASLFVLASVLGQSQAWPSRYTDCRAFPMLGEPQQRFKGHPSIGLVCEPLGDTTFEYCMENCSGTGEQSSCKSKCKCEEKCFSDPVECAQHKSASESEPDTLSARAGSTAVLVDGNTPMYYTPGSTHRFKVVPGTIAESEDSARGDVQDLQRSGGTATHFLFDVGVGTLSQVGSIASWHEQCDGTRVGFKANEAVELDWVAPSSGEQKVVLRVAAATNKGDITVNSIVIESNRIAVQTAWNSTEAVYACTVSEGYTHQCLRVPVGTHGATDQQSCSAQCAPHRCSVCQHVFFPNEDGDGAAFEDLPETWTCPVCGSPKSVYTNALPDVQVAGSLTV